MVREVSARSGGALFVDQYELTMAQAYVAAGMEQDRATFSLYVRSLPRHRNYLVAAGLDAVLEWLESWRVTEDDAAYLRSLGTFSEPFLAWLRAQRFEGDVRALPEGTLFFPEEPVLEVDAPIAQAQLAESFVLNRIHAATSLASKAARIVTAAAGRSVVDFALRRSHGGEGALMAARAFHLAGVGATSNMAAAARYGIPPAGTMAHSFVEAFDDELDAFRAFAREHPSTTLLVDTYDTLEGVRRVVALARELGDAFRIQAVRLDSGSLGELATAARAILDEAGLQHVSIVASGGLDEDAIARLVAEDRPIDGFGVGTAMGVSEDAPTLDMAYKLVEYRGLGRMKLSTGKRTLPGRKQAWRFEERGRALEDVIGRADEAYGGRPLLTTVMRNGARTDRGREPLEVARRRAREELARMPDHVRALAPARPPYPVSISDALRAELESVRRRVAG